MRFAFKTSPRTLPGTPYLRCGGHPAQILLSCQVQFIRDQAQTAATVADFGTAGAKLAIVYLPPPHTPAMLESLATALPELS